MGDREVRGELHCYTIVNRSWTLARSLALSPTRGQIRVRKLVSSMSSTIHNMSGLAKLILVSGGASNPARLSLSPDGIFVRIKLVSAAHWVKRAELACGQPFRMCMQHHWTGGVTFGIHSIKLPTLQIEECLEGVSLVVLTSLIWQDIELEKKNRYKSSITIRR